ncbi:MAG: adenylyltransferase/cytidyltransferase family protein, partial [Gammaproteobacteria bacterium]|nr:adenylyltransferase/cytidyltransferase family protein [Gammaproteobacteria bacterium]
MKLVRHLRNLPYADLAEGSIVTIGSFDGLHLGHRQLLEQVLSLSAAKSMPSIVMSFEPTPKEFFALTNPPARLMRFREKFDALAEFGVDIFY